MDIVVFYTKCKINLFNLLIENGVWYFSNIMLSCSEQSFDGFVRLVTGKVTVLLN